MLNFKEKIREYKRVVTVARKPTKDEFVTSSKICAIGIFIIGIVGFIIFVIFVLLGI
jgi:protein transport protein SEC61 subunit gamma-like protein